jgi:hypothetical protein
MKTIQFSSRPSHCISFRSLLTLMFPNCLCFLFFSFPFLFILSFVPSCFRVFRFVSGHVSSVQFCHCQFPSVFLCFCLIIFVLLKNPCAKYWSVWILSRMILSWIDLSDHSGTFNYINFITLHYITLHHITLDYITLHYISAPFVWSSCIPIRSLLLIIFH